MKKLFLASSFRKMLANEKLRGELLNLLGKDPKNILIGHIPNAADPKEDKSFVKESIDQLKAMGMKIREVDLRNENEKSIKEELSMCDAIFVNGGNTFYLLDIIKKSGVISKYRC